MKNLKDIIYIGVDDLGVDLFEGQYTVPEGMAYNSYIILDEKTAVMDTVDKAKADEWLAKLAAALDGTGACKDENGAPVMKRWWEVTDKDIDAMLGATKWCSANETFSPLPFGL